ncbi:hypothetical protein [Tengunoibacter tsumagoiensis]|uniref:DUF4352 domain-containing protein n=1 Tax=Tengunoibacter tsumagoiensis TaxID=2014871 RepID=A0A402AA45_9CHLR|nr:hypothetical protein [Tengunoibacter tsumagoiensis]GCE16044.1 hypothetical protein KTT_59030 [Tengunoibacter tsumagoiensis]
MKVFKLSGHTMAFLSIFGLALLFTACGTDTTGGTTGLPPATTATKTATTQTGTVVPTSTTTSSGTDSGQGVTFTYASVKYTLLSVEQKSTFSDDDDSSAPQHVRINLKEENTYADTAFIFYSDSIRLILPNNTTVTPNKEQDSTPISQGVARTNWIDFPVPSQQTLSSLVVQFGTATEYQFLIPLSAHPNLSKYQDKSVSPNATLHYKIDWKLLKATSSFSYADHQADKGKKYILIDLQADNSTSDAFFPFPTDNFRLKAGGESQAPKAVDSSLSGSIAANSTGTKGTVAFLVPADATSFTLDFLAQPSEKIDEATATFTLS